MISAIPSFDLYTTADTGFMPVLICDDGTQIELPPHSAAELLLAAVEIDLTAYTDAVRHLRETHPLFEEKLDISVLEYRDFLSQALELPEQLRRTDPVGWLDASVHLRAALQQPDDGSASFLLYSGQRILQAIERPVLLQVRLRNIFEMIFDNMDISMPHRQWEYLRTAYPDVAQQCDPIQLKEVTGSFRLSTVNGWNYYLTILSLYFAQETQRITRCVHCWEYFIPPTRKRTLYCDRSYDGQTCKRRGANLMRHERDEQDEALFIYRQLRDRMYARMQRYDTAIPEKRGRLLVFSASDFKAWMDNASKAHREYTGGKIDSSEFLRRIDTWQELSSYDVKARPLVVDTTVWQQRVAADMDHAPADSFPEQVMFLNVPTDGSPAQWEMKTRDQLRREAQKGHQSLRDKYTHKEKQN